MESITCPHLNNATAHIALFKNISSPGQLKQRLIHASTMQGEQGDIERSKVNFAFIDSRLIISLSHLLTAIHQALLAQSSNSLRTKTIHSEILWFLNPTNNIGEAIRLFGIGEKTSNLIIVRVEPSSPSDNTTTTEPSPSANSILEEMKATISTNDQQDKSNYSSPVELSQLSQLVDIPSLKKVYKLTTSHSSDSSDSLSTLEKLVISIVATKSAQ